MRNWVKRAVRTFVQTAFGYIAVNIVAVDFNVGWEVAKSALLGVGVSAVAAGLAAVINFIEDENKKFED